MMNQPDQTPTKSVQSERQLTNEARDFARVLTVIFVKCHHIRDQTRQNAEFNFHPTNAETIPP